MRLDEIEIEVMRLSKLDAQERVTQIRAMKSGDRNTILNSMTAEMRSEYRRAECEYFKETEKKIATVFESAGWKVETSLFLKKESSRYPIDELDIALYIEDKLIGGSVVKFFDANDIGLLNRTMRDMAFKMVVYHLQFVMLFIGEKVYLFTEDGLKEIKELPTPENYRKFTEGNAGVFKWIDEIAQENSKSEKEPEDPTVKILEMLERLQKDVSVVKDTQKEISNQIGDISDKLDGIANRLENYQAIVSRQLERAEDESEKESIYSAFMDEMVDHLKEEIKIDRSMYDYEVQDKTLACKFGAIWNDGRIDDKTKKFIISAHILFESQKSYDNYLDYSGVCILLTKAVEVELKNRFYFMFLEYLKENYPPETEIDKYPTSLVFVNPKKNYKKEILKQTRYTLGSVPVTLGTRDYSSEKQKNKERLLEFAQARLMPSKSKDEIEEILRVDGERVEYITSKFRNPSAHTNALNIDVAKECLDTLIDVERQLIKIISDFEA